MNVRKDKRSLKEYTAPTETLQMKRIINIQYTGKHNNSNEKCAIQMKN